MYITLYVLICFVLGPVCFPFILVYKSEKILIELFIFDLYITYKFTQRGLIKTRLLNSVPNLLSVSLIYTIISNSYPSCSNNLGSPLT